MMRTIKEKTDTNVKRLLAFQGYVLYCYNPENLNCKLIPLPRLDPTLRIKTTGEVFQLGRPSLYIEGKPLFIIIRGFPFSIDIKLNENRDKLIERGYNPAEIDARIHSIYTQRIFRAPKITLQSIVIVFLLILSSCLVTYMITSMYFQSIIEQLKEGKEAFALFNFLRWLI